MNRPTETGVGLEPISKHLQNRASKQWYALEAEVERQRAREDAALKAYEASKKEAKS